MSLAELFPDGDFRFHLTLRRAEPGQFFAARDRDGDVLRERSRWLDDEPGRYAGAQPESGEAVREFATVAQAWVPGLKASDAASPLQIVEQLGRALEPDVLFLTAGPDGQFRLRAGALCFPTGWALTEKLGETLAAIHGVVPGLNAALGEAIQQFISRLKPGQAYLRDNWGIAASSELNLHPARGIPAPELPVDLQRLWLRVEHQALMALPQSRALVFGIRIALHRLDGIARGPHSARLRQALASMPAEVAAYKRLDRIRNHLLNVV